MATDTSDLPNDMVRIILSRLPVKSLLRFKTVSKSWNIMMTHPEFVKTHLLRSKSSSSHNLFLSSDGFGQFYLAKFEGRKFQIEANLGYTNNNRKVICVCDGLVLLISFRRRNITYVLWNPSTRVESIFWCPYNWFDHIIDCGLCHDPTIDDFKVVIICVEFYAVFSYKNNCWIKKECSFCMTGTVYGSGVSVDEAIYWVWSDEGETDDNNEIIYFDPRGDEFKILKRPKDVKDDDTFFLTSLKRCLCLYRERGDRMIDIWIKNQGRDDNSWTELMIIENWTEPIEYFQPICFMENKLVIWLKGRDTKIIMYSPCEKTIIELGKNKLHSVTLVPCVDSLFFPKLNIIMS